MSSQANPVAGAGAVWARTFAALRYRNFRLFLAGQLISVMGTWMQSTAQGWLVYQLTGSKLLLGVVAAAGAAPIFFLSLWGGSVADRHAKRTVMYWTQSVEMLLAFALAALVATGLVRPWHVIALAGLMGVTMAFDMPARQAFFVEMTGRAELGNAIALNSTVFNGARMLGPVVAGFVMAHWGIAWCFFLNGLSFVPVLVALTRMELPPFTPPAPTPFWEHGRDGLRHVWQNRPVRLMLGLLGIVGIFGWSYAVLMPALARDVMGVSERGYGALLAANGIGAFVGALWLASTGSRHANRSGALAGLAVFGGMLVALALTRRWEWALVWLTLAGGGMMLFFATANTLIQVSVPDELRGRAMGVWALLFGGLIPVGSLVAGSLAQRWGVPVALGLGGAVCVAAAGTGLFAARPAGKEAV